MSQAELAESLSVNAGVDRVVGEREAIRLSGSSRGGSGTVTYRWTASSNLGYLLGSNASGRNLHRAVGLRLLPGSHTDAHGDRSPRSHGERRDRLPDSRSDRLPIAAGLRRDGACDCSRMPASPLSVGSREEPVPVGRHSVRRTLCEPCSRTARLQTGPRPVPLCRGVRSRVGLFMAARRAAAVARRAADAADRASVPGPRRRRVGHAVARAGEEPRLFIGLFRVVGEPGVVRAGRHARAGLPRADDRAR